MSWKDPRIFPTILIVFDLLASLWWLMAGDFRRTTYWIAAAVLTACITF